MPAPTRFLSCDWGTSSFRLKLVELPGLRVLAQAESDEGNAATFAAWQQSGQPAGQRVAFYQGILTKHLRTLEQQQGTSLHDVPLVVSGMASSTIGMRELPYKPLPFATDGSDLTTQLFAPSAAFPYSLLLISGVKTADDVMRGEEVQLVGCHFATSDQEQLFLHPGTHCKHVRVRGGQAVALETYMTGEFFALLSSKSILAASVKAGGELSTGAHRQAFERGVRDSTQANLLHNAFRVRTNDLFDKLSKPANSYYLSGILIGAELSTFPADYAGHIVVAGEPHLLEHYAAALELLGISARAASVTLKGAEEVTLRGQAAVLAHAWPTHQP
ncbi:2-dehydro-3-deoxygalactonokinase [Hymenobacter persicinus]|uniref:2-dehydro-3-deoxygalactonokinase n=1 Tax=Hymenobacter persicinus TaxID=2025506 RepID=A0A4V1ZAG9_9BACT|nr:2-dehydro-3-deoxygalactonokinase [Hymenobacter persicinus]RYU78067.1 2-dehydro-3-deoxygalactonokinase [Hymenobacter persicinus]